MVTDFVSILQLICVFLDKSLNSSGPHISHVKMEIMLL